MLINKLIQENIYSSKNINKILMSALESVDPNECVKRFLKINDSSLIIKDQEVNLQKVKRIYLIGVGKAVLPMASAVSDVMGDLISEGALIAKHTDSSVQSKLNRQIKVLIGSHPIPSENSVKSTGEMLEMLKKTTPDDLVIGLISGGGSALMTYPVEEIGLASLQKITSLLLKCGATIEEMNTIRKHLDLVKGGGLLKYIYPAKSIHLILSDVLGDPLSMIASGPTSADPTTYQNCLDIIHKFKIFDQVDEKVLEYLQKGSEGSFEETLKEGNTKLKDHSNFIVGSLSIAAEAARAQAEALGFETRILTTSLRGEARIVGSELARQLVELVKTNPSREKPLCLIAGGETTVTVTGNGKGGRNQELALAAAQVLQGVNNCAFITFATDGEDGPTDAAGGLVTGKTIQSGLDLGLNSQNYLNENNAYEYLEKTRALIRTGPTGTNVNDLVLMFAF